MGGGGGGGGGGRGGLKLDVFFCFQVDGPIIRGAYKWWGLKTGILWDLLGPEYKVATVYSGSGTMS